MADGSRFCPYCGLHLDASGEPTADTRPDEGRPDDRQEHAGPSTDGPVQGPDLLACARCGAPNSQHRVLCGRCGADLETGDVGVQPRPTTPARSGAPDTGPVEPRSTSRRAWLAVIVLGALIGSAIGAVMWLRAAGGGVDPEEHATFDPALYSGEPEDLQVDRASASSELPPEGSIGYGPAQAIDGDPTTAWNEGADGHGEGEQLRLQFAEPVWVRRLVIRNGYQKDGRTYYDNSRADRLLVHLDGTAYVVDLHDQPGEQAVTLPEPVRARSVTLEVVEAVPGGSYDDLAISEVRVQGWRAEETPSG